jgi:hypothetical protein
MADASASSKTGVNAVSLERSGGRRQCSQRRQPLPARRPLRKSETPRCWPGSSLRGVGSLETLRKPNSPHSYEAKGSPIKFTGWRVIGRSWNGRPGYVKE